ncbi:MAG: FkbM family methyltransferase [Actinomycetota bacterium]
MPAKSSALPRYAWNILRARNLSARARAQLLGAAVGTLAPWRNDHRIDLRDGFVMLRGTDLRSDVATFYEIFVRHCYAGSYRGRVVIDLGAHCGYFGSYALLQGARAVISLEPERANFRSLEKTAHSFRARGFDWKTSRSAVASREGTVSLYLGLESRAHSLSSTFNEEARGVERVHARQLASVLHEAAVGTDATLIVKLNIEGSECDVVLRTPKEAWDRVDEVFLAYHEGVGCSLEQLLDRLAEAGLTRVGAHEGRVHHLVRE